MTLRLITGRSGSGKTRCVLDEIRGKLREDPQGPPLVLLVPEQATFQAEHAMATTPGLGGFMRVQVLSFRRLAFRVLQETGGLAAVPIHDNGKAMLIHKVLEARREELRLFRGGPSENGLISRINELLTEWKRYGVSSRRVREAASGAGGSDTPLLGDKLHDLSMIYADLERELSGRWMDGEDMLERLAEAAGSSDWLAEAEIWLDGFHGFTPGELSVVEGLLRRARRVTVALCLDKPYGAGERPDELLLFHPTAVTSVRLCELAEAAGVPMEAPVVLDPPVPPRFAGNPWLAFLERHWEQRSRVWDGGSHDTADGDGPEAGLSLHAAANRRAEAEAAARDMLRRVREEGGRWRDFAVFVRRLDDYADLLSAVFSDYGIPYYLDGKAAVSHHPFVEFVRSALECATGGWKAEAVFRCAKTDLLGAFGSRVSRDDIDRLENYALAAGIDGWRWHDDRMWRPLARGDLEEEAAAGEERPDRLLKIRDALLTPLRALERRLKKATSVRASCEALYRFLEETAAADWLENRSLADAAAGQPGRAAVHRPLWDAVMNLLDQLVELMGEEKLDPQLFAGMIDSGLEALKLGAVPPSLDAVLVGTPERTRSDRLRSVYFLGASDGALPMRIPENGLLSEAERERLSASGLKMAPGARRRLLDERFLAYLAFTAPSRHLWISWPLADDEGAGVLPSEWIGRLRRRFPGLSVRMVAGEPQADESEDAQLAFAVHPGRAMTHLLARLRKFRQGEAPSPGWWSVYNWLIGHPDWNGRLKRLLVSLSYTNEERPLEPQTSRALYGDRLLASVSRMERFVSCPFRHFALHGLRLKERRLYRVDAPDIGQLFHAALRQTTEKLFGQALSADAAAWQREAAAAVERLLPKVQSQILLSSHRHGVMARKLRDIVARASAMLGEQAKVSAFKPVGLELDFGPDAALPPLTLDLGDGRFMDVAGRIDRVDAAETPDGLLLRILDYKSGPVKLRLDEVAHGLTLQMLTYLDVVVTHAPHWLGKPAEPAGVLYFHVRNPLLASANGMTREEAQEAMLREFRMQGLVLADGTAVRLMDETLEAGAAKSAVVPVEFKKDGSFSARSQVADRPQWEVLRSSVRGQIRKIGRRIADGDVAIAPYRMEGRSPCVRCEFRPVCQFDPELDGNGYRLLAKPGSREQLWRKLEEQAGRREPQ